MKILKLMFAVLAALFVVAHLIEIPARLGSVSGDLALSWWMGKLIGILIGSVLAVGLFRSALK